MGLRDLDGETAWLVVVAIEGASSNSCVENPLSCEEGGVSYGCNPEL